MYNIVLKKSVIYRNILDSVSAHLRFLINNVKLSEKYLDFKSLISTSYLKSQSFIIERTIIARSNLLSLLVRRSLTII
jgi:hypothetical protein